ncbi:hypothetical protein G7Y79_00051g087010 [Physcia stellaris]|nr:hypothetical protein G7Y79_00051g087010 [Physcia stellaris]
MSAIPIAVAEANKTCSPSDPAYVNRMAPLTLAQDRLARGQNPGPSGPPSSQFRTGLKSPAKPRVYLRLPGCYHKDKSLMETKEEPMPGVKKNEMWEESQRRHKAAVILGSWEMTTWHSVAGNESSPQTALRLKRMLIGLPDQPGSDQWEDERNPGDDDSGQGSSKHSEISPQAKGGPRRKH